MFTKADKKATTGADSEKPAAAQPSVAPSSGLDRSRTAAAPARSSMPSIIGSDLKVIGNLHCDGDIQVDGNVQGDVKSRNLTIGEHGSVSGEIDADMVQVSGTVKGRIRAKTVTLARSARLIGDIAHESLAMESGAHLEGQVSRLQDGAAVQPAAAAAAPRPSTALGGTGS